MSCPTQIHFHNHKEGTQKRVFANLGWAPPTDYELMKIFIQTESQISTTYAWDTLFLPAADLKMSRENFELAAYVVGELDNRVEQRLFNIKEYCE